MLYRKIEGWLTSVLSSDNNQIVLLDGARQIGKSFIIREVGTRLFPHFVELNFIKDDEQTGIFRNIHSTDDFYLSLSSVAGNNLGDWNDTLIFLDEIQKYPQYFTLLKFFREDHRYRFIASGSLLGLTLRSTNSIPVGSVIRKTMFQLDLEEWLMANGVGMDAIENYRNHYEQRVSLSEEQHEFLMNHTRKYLLVGGMPDVVNTYLQTHNIAKVREVQNALMQLYKDDAAQYEDDLGEKLMIGKIYDMIVSQMENKKKRIVARDIQDRKGDRFNNYGREFEYLEASGISLGVHAISSPRYPLSESMHKNLVKLYYNDVGLLTARLYKWNLAPILNTEKSVNLGAVYESVVAQQLKANGLNLFYYDNRQKGEVDFIIDDYSDGSVLPIEVKSGRDYAIHSALSAMVTNPDYPVTHALVLSNNQEMKQVGKIEYLPIYCVMFIRDNVYPSDSHLLF